MPQKFLRVVIRAISLAVFIHGGCRSLEPSHRPTSRNLPVVKDKPNVTVLTDSILEPQRLRPLREYMDEIVRRQEVIEARLDTIARDLSILRQHVSISSPQRKIASSADTIVAGTPQPDSTVLPSLRQQAGVILPDNNDAGKKPFVSRLISPRGIKSKNVVKRSLVQPEQTNTNPNLRAAEQRYSGTKQRRAVGLEERRLLDSGLVLIRNGRYTEANTVFTSLIERGTPRQGEYYYWRALTSFLQHQNDNALRDAESAWKLLHTTTLPIRADLQYLLAELYSERGDFDQARKYLRAVIEQFPQSDAAVLARRKLQQITAAK